MRTGDDCWRGIRLWLAALLAASLAACASGPHGAPARYDLLLAGGTVIDGTGADRYVADVAIRGGAIAAIGQLERAEAREVIDAGGMVIAPGFIDVHSHADQALRDPATAGMEGFLRQGVTTAVFGIDGEASLADLKANISAAEAGRSGLNFLSYIGHNGVRQHVMGMDNRAPDSAELEAMRREVDAAMQMGAFGLSSGLMYLPGRYATTAEVIALAEVVAPYGGGYDTHTRDPVNDWLGSVTEALDVGEAAGVRVHLAHEKAVGAANFGLSGRFIELVEARIAAGADITADLYPYDGATTRTVLAILYPGTPAAQEDLRAYAAAMEQADAQAAGSRDSAAALVRFWSATLPGSEAYAASQRMTEAPGAGIYSWIETVGYKSIRIVESRRAAYRGRMVTELAAEMGVHPFELLRQLVVEEGPDVLVTLGAIREDEVRAIMLRPWVMIASDGEEITVEHPRGRGTFPRVLGPYVREWGVLSLEAAVHKMTGMPAAYLRLRDRGTLRVGAAADITIFDPDAVRDRADWAQPRLYATGIRDVLIGGEFALRAGSVTPRRLGRFIAFRGDGPAATPASPD